MKNQEISDLLSKIAFLMSIKGVNQFKIRAYERVARMVAESEIPFAEFAKEGKLLEIDGIGKSIAPVIKEFVEKGKSTVLDELLGDIPPTIFEVVEIPGVGPKKAGQLYFELGIASLEDLDRSAKAGMIAKLKGFGEKSQASIIKGIELRKSAMRTKSISYLLPLSREIVEHLEKTGAVTAISEVGEIRRRRETSEVLEILCATEDPTFIISSFIRMPLVKKIEKKNDTNAVILTDNGFPVAITTVHPDKYVLELFRKTGSINHVLTVKKLIEKKGFVFGDNGEIIDSSGKQVFISDESEIYALIDLPFVPPEIREDGDEIFQLINCPLPELINIGAIKGDMQMHSTYSDGSASIRNMATKAMELGYSYIAITDHSKSLRIANGLDSERIALQQEEIDALNAEFDGRFRIFKSAEVDILSDGSLDYSDEILKNFDFVLISVHSSMKMSREKMTERIIRAIQHPGVHCLGHPTGRLIGRRDGFDADWDAIFEAAKKARIALEINAHPSRLDLDDKRCRKAKEMGIPIMINTDAHSPNELNLMEYGVYVARRGWLSSENVLNTMGIDGMEMWLKERWWHRRSI